ncbi:Pyruvate decarboxylase 1 [Clarireedia jacksonii]
MIQVKIGDYLFKRLRELGIESVFGVPGDYELALLDLVTDNELKWKGSPKELIASYAADGYARVKGAAAFITTFGPGELSAYCVAAQKSQAIMHHSLEDGRFDMYENMAKHITAATTVITNPRTASSEIDRVLNIMMRESRPVYIGLSVDIATGKKVVTVILSEIERVARPIIIVDGGAVRHNVLPEVNALIELTWFPTFVTAMGKSGVNEELPNFGGVYADAGMYPEVKEAVESSDLVLWIGNYPSDFNTREFTTAVEEGITLDFQQFSVKWGSQYNVAMKYVRLFSSLSWLDAKF